MPKPCSLRLYGQDLPWVVHANHLGHELQENGDQDFECSKKRVVSIEITVQIHEAFSFTYPS